MIAMKGRLPSNPLAEVAASEQMRPKFLEMTPLEVGPFAEEDSLGGAFRMLKIFDCGKFDAACVIGNLQKSIVARFGVPVYDCVLCHGVLEGGMQYARHERLTVIVINLDDIELLKSIKMIEQVLDEVASQARCERIDVLETTLLVGKDMIGEGGVGGEDLECAENELALADVHMTVIVMGMEQRAKVKGNVCNASVGERLTITGNGCLDVVVLVVKHQSDEIVVGFSTDVARLVDKDRKLLHGDNPLENKNAGGNPPALDSPLKQDDQRQYSTPLRFAAVPFPNHYGKDVAL